MSHKRARWYAGSILGAAGVGALLGLAYFSQAFSLRLSVAMVSAVAVYFASAFASFCDISNRDSNRLFPDSGSCGRIGWSCVFVHLPLSSTLVDFSRMRVRTRGSMPFLLTRKISHSAGTGESE